MSDEEMNSAEREAEEILRAAVSEVRACPDGEDCPVHSRSDSEFTDDLSEYAEIVTYVGDYAVATCDNSDLALPMELIQAIFDLPNAPESLPRFETLVWYVGKGCLADIGKREQDLYEACRYRATHDDWRLIRQTHNVIVGALEQGMIDTSKPWDGE